MLSRHARERTGGKSLGTESTTTSRFLDPFLEQPRNGCGAITDVERELRTALGKERDRAVQVRMLATLLLGCKPNQHHLSQVSAAVARYGVVATMFSVIELVGSIPKKEDRLRFLKLRAKAWSKAQDKMSALVQSELEGYRS